MRLTWPEVVARRVVRHHLAGPAADPDGPAKVAAAMCGAHAQVMSAAEVSVAIRLDGATRADVRRALWDDRTLIKAHGPRGTVHLLPARDFGMWSGALAALPAPNTFAKDVRLTAEQTARVVAAIDDALSTADDSLTIDELDAAVVERAGPWAGEKVMPAFQTFWSRWRQIVGSAATQGVLCFGPQRGRNVTYTSPVRWSPGFSRWEPEAAVRELIKRFLRSYGPATSAQAARWLAAPPRLIADLFASLADELRPVTVDGEQSWLLADDTAFPPPEAAAGVRLLPYFDAYAVGSHPRDVVFPGRAAERALAGGQAGNFPVLLIDGLAAGVWHQRLTGRRVAVTVEPLSPLSPAHRAALEVQVARLGHLHEATPTLTVGQVRVGAHA